jgi:F-type H+-transporting ATPase subunit b
MELLTPGFGLVVWTVITFLILFFLLKKFAWKPILGAVHDRETSIKSALDSAEAARREMENLQADNERILQEARTERDSIIKEARSMKDKMIADASDEAQAKADQIIKQAQAAILSEKQAAIADIKNQVANLSIDISEKVVREELSNKEKQAKLVEDMLGDVTLN